MSSDPLFLLLSSLVLSFILTLKLHVLVFRASTNASFQVQAEQEIGDILSVSSYKTPDIHSHSTDLDLGPSLNQSQGP